MNAHVERPTRLADGKTYCACGRPWPCPHAAPADPSAILAEIRDRNIDAWAEGGTSDIPALLAAVEAALKAADGWERLAARLDATAGRAIANKMPETAANLSDQAQCNRGCANALREAITAALAGKEGSEDG